MSEEKQTPPEVILDGQKVPIEKLEEAKENRATRIAETPDGQYKTLHKLKE
jgi:hypothetical protein